MLRKIMILLLGVALLGAGMAGQASASTGFSLSMGSDDFYMSVGNYDYYPYTLPYYNRTPRISFHNVMGEYGTWVSVSPFGQVWRPYVRSNWRPYVNGHWSYTRYGPTWVGYEPWAWAGYHYGNWIWSSRYGWVWIPGYDWHPGRVLWSHGNDTIGWMPAPPQGYDYSNGYLDYRGSNGQFDYYDDDFGYNDDDYYDDNYYDDGYYDDEYYDRGRYNSGYNNPFYGSGYRNIVVNLWIFIDVNQYRNHNYRDCYLDSDYTRALFDRRLVRISSRPMERRTLERIVRHKVNEASVQVREFETNNRRVKIVVPVGEEENIRRNANRTVKNVIAPAFAEKRREFKGLNSENATVINKVFKQENRQPKIKKQTVEEVLREIDRENGQVEQQRKNIIREKTDKVIRSHEAAKSRNKQQDGKGKNVRPGNEKKSTVPQRDQQIKTSPSKKERGFEVESKPKHQDRDEQFAPKVNNKQDRGVFETRPNPKPKAEPKVKQNPREEQFKTSTSKKERGFEVESKPKHQDRDEQFAPKVNNKQDRGVFETRPNPKPKAEPKVKQNRREEQFNTSTSKKERDQFQSNRNDKQKDPRALETRQDPKATDRGFEFESKLNQRNREEMEKRNGQKQDQESSKRKISSKTDETQSDAQKTKTEQEKAKKKKSEDSKKRKQDEPSR